MSDKDFKVKNKLILNGLAGNAGPLIASASNVVDSTPYIPTQYGGTGTTTSPSSGQVLYSSSGTTYAPTDLSSLLSGGAKYQANAPTSPQVGDIWIESDSNSTVFDQNIIRREAFVATAGQTAFTASQSFIEGYEQVYFNGLLLLRTTDYSTSGSTVTLSSAAAAGDIIEIFTITNLNSYNPTPYSSISSNTTLAAGTRYFVTSASALTLTLPGNPTVNDQVDIFDASGNANTYNITVSRNGKLINGNAGNLIIDTAGAWMSLIFTGNTYGWKAA